jgi:hypothetical protein
VKQFVLRWLQYFVGLVLIAALFTACAYGYPKLLIGRQVAVAIGVVFLVASAAIVDAE